ncbi:death domain-containing protein 1 [Rhinophrynus dorsalis]
MVRMELAATNLTSAEDNLISILTQIKLNNQKVNDVLEGSHLKNNEELEGIILALFSLIRDLSRTFCEKLSKASESLQSTFHLFKGLQSKFKDVVSNNEQINYLININQILFDAARSLNKAEKQWGNLHYQYRDTEDQARVETTKIDTNNQASDGNTSSMKTVDSTQSDKLDKSTFQKTVTQNNVQEDEISSSLTMDKELLIRNTSENVSEKDSKGETQQSVEHLQVKEQKSKCEEQPESTLEPHHDDYLKTSESDKENRRDISSSTVTCNGTKLNLSIERLLELENWCYKEYMSQIDGESEQRLACFITAPAYILDQIEVRFIEDISSLVVSDSEELVSCVLSILSQNSDLKIPFPLNISIPYNSRYRGNYKDVMVKANNEQLQSSYITPHSLDGYHGNHKGSFAEVKVYKLGIFSVVSCLKKESFTVLKKGLSIKLSMDPRICFNYPAGCFSSSVIVQFKVQPIDTAIISLLKVKHDIYHSVVSSSPLVHVKHPSVKCFHKPVTVLLPCPPNPEKKKQGEETENKRASSALASRVSSTHQIRPVSASVRKHGDNTTELLKLLAYREDQWNILDDIVVKNVQNGTVSFEVDEHIQSFIVIRLSSAMDNAYLMSFIQSLEIATHSSMVNVVLYRKKDNLQKAIVEVVPSKELNWEIHNLREAGYTGPPEPSEQMQLQEGEQIHFRVCGNITASDGKEFGKTFKLTFHAQRKQRLPLHLSVIDEYGNYSSPHYKGTVVFYKLSREDIAECYKNGLLTDTCLQQRTPVCKLALTLPKIEKIISRPSSTKISTSDPADIQWDNLLHWLAQELSEEDASLLAFSLPLRRSTIQLVKLKCPDNLTDQLFELLSFWKKSLPTSADKFRLLARHLRKSGRSDLLESLKIKWETKMF